MGRLRDDRKSILTSCNDTDNSFVFQPRQEHQDQNPATRNCAENNKMNRVIDRRMQIYFPSRRSVRTEVNVPQNNFNHPDPCKARRLPTSAE
jgi:hypothetical protein